MALLRLWLFLHAFQYWTHLRCPKQKRINSAMVPPHFTQRNGAPAPNGVSRDTPEGARVCAPVDRLRDLRHQRRDRLVDDRLRSSTNDSMRIAIAALRADRRQSVLIGLRATLSTAIGWIIEEEWPACLEVMNRLLLGQVHMKLFKQLHHRLRRPSPHSDRIGMQPLWATLREPES
jgi:hypothetical protein